MSKTLEISRSNYLSLEGSYEYVKIGAIPLTQKVIIENTNEKILMKKQNILPHAQILMNKFIRLCTRLSSCNIFNI